MNDRELLELAAKACGYGVESVSETFNCLWAYPEDSIQNVDGEWPIFLWDPLGNSGDALRLATDLDIGLEFVDGIDIVIAKVDIVGIENPHESYHPDKMAAVRRAILRGAAEIGKP